MLITIILLAAIALLLWMLTKKPDGYPPGPFRLPFIGYAMFVDVVKPHKTWSALQKRYGNVVGLYMGNTRTLLVNGWEAATEALGNQHLNGRPSTFVNVDRYGKDMGIMFVNGDHWMTQRRFALHHFRNLGVGKRSHQDIILEEVHELIGSLTKEKGPVDPQGTMAVTSINILWAVVAGQRHSHDNEKLQQLAKVIYDAFRTGQAAGGVLNLFPPIRHVAPDLTGYTALKEVSDGVINFIKEAVEEHRKTYDAANIRDFVDIFLHELNKDGKHESFTDMQLLAACSDVFLAGAETGSSLMGFCILFMCMYPEWQDALHQELDELLAETGRPLPTIDDRHRLVKTEAFLSEVFRFRCPAPLTVPHWSVQDTMLQGYKVPKDSMILINLRSVMMEESYWKDPLSFKPERFIADDGSVRRDERLIPFGKGKRVCLGEPLARMTSFLLLTGLTSQLSFSLPPGVPVPDSEGNTGFTLGPPRFKVLIEKRKQN